MKTHTYQTPLTVSSYLAAVFRRCILCEVLQLIRHHMYEALLPATTTHKNTHHTPTTANKAQSHKPGNR